MTNSVSRPNTRAWGTQLFELLGSMRFAVSLLMFICIASIIGTVLQQSQPDLFYTDKFGMYWYAVFSKFGVAQIYNTWWFLAIMAFLVVSTSICVIRNAPKMLKDMRSFREYIREGSLRAFPHRIDLHSTGHTPAATVDHARAWLKKEGYAVREKHDDMGTLLAAKKGTVNRLGYVFAHLAIVIVCVGGLLDSELPNRLQIWLGGKQPIPDSARFVSDVPPDSRFSTGNPSFRGNVSIAEGSTSNTGIIALSGGQYLQMLPVDIKLNKFIIEYYQSNGMPKRFASEVTITDKETGKVSNETIEVNHPYQTHGITLYQSSFHDGGSKLALTGYPLSGSQSEPIEVAGAVGEQAEVTANLNGQSRHYTVTFDDFKPINVEDLSGPTPGAAKPKTFQEDILAVTGSAAGKQDKKLHNIGPSVSYTLTDDRNQSIKFNNYMLPVMLEGAPVFLVGMQLPGDTMFRYVRIPSDSKSTPNEFLAMRRAFNDPAMRRKAAEAYAEKNQDNRIDKSVIVQLAERALSVFAADGFIGIDKYVEGDGVPEKDRVPAELREPMKKILREYLLFSAIELRNLVREQAGQAPIVFGGPDAEAQARWFDQSLRAVSDLTNYPAPMYFQLKTFQHIQATVLQATRSPGKLLVYGGSILLILGVFSMFYIRDRRIWIWVKPGEGDQDSRMMAAMTSQKRTLDFNREFERFRHHFIGNEKA